MAQYSYFPHDPWRLIGKSHTIAIATGEIFYHNANGNGSITSEPCVFLKDHIGTTPVYRGPHSATVANRMVHWLSMVNPNKVNMVLLLKSVDWHREPEEFKNPAIAAGLADSMAGRVTEMDFTEYST